MWAKTACQAIYAHILRSETIFGKSKKSKSVKLNLTLADFLSVLGDLAVKT